MACLDENVLIDYLSGRPPFSDRERFVLPGLLLLDLKMPRCDGFEVLAWLRLRPQFAALPVVMFSASISEADAKRALQLGAADYYSKPCRFSALVETVQVFHRRWLRNGAAADLQTLASVVDKPLPTTRLQNGSSNL